MYIYCMYFGILGESVDVGVARPEKVLLYVLYFLYVGGMDPLENKMVHLKDFILSINFIYLFRF